MASPRSLTSADWIEAAWTVFRELGIGAVKVEVIATRLGATKGSFYWHFRNRKELVDALMEHWSHVETERLIQIADSSGKPEERLQTLFTAVAQIRNRRSGELTLYVEADREGITDVVRRVTERRVNYLADILVELGFDRAESLRRATIAVALVIGIEQIVAGTGAVPEAATHALTTTALTMMLAR